MAMPPSRRASSIGGGIRLGNAEADQPADKASCHRACPATGQSRRRGAGHDDPQAGISTLVPIAAMAAAAAPIIVPTAAARGHTFGGIAAAPIGESSGVRIVPRLGVFGHQHVNLIGGVPAGCQPAINCLPDPSDPGTPR